MSIHRSPLFMKNTSLFSSWKQDLPASIVVFLVALPLCLGIAAASGAPPIAGLIAGIVGGIVVGSISGSPLGVSGPAAGLIAIVLTAVEDLGAYELFLGAVVMSGLIQISLGLLKGGIIAYYFPNSVIKGMLAGIGILILRKQIFPAVGYDEHAVEHLTFEEADHYDQATEFSNMLQNITPGAVVITVVGLALLLLWERPFIQRIRALATIPGSLMAVVAGIVLALIFQGHSVLEVGAGHFVALPELPKLSNIGEFDFGGLITMPDFGALLSYKFWMVAFTLAIVASLETLLCVEATDKLDPWKRVTPANRELHAQGIGNSLSGLIGGIPITQVIVRSSANIQSGGRSKLSAILHGVLLLVAVLAIPGILMLIPMASLAAVLLMVGYKLAKPSQFKQMWKAGTMQFFPFVVTVIGVATIDLLTGVFLGLAVAIIHILWKNYSTPFHFDPAKHLPGMPIHIELSEDVTFLNKAGIKRTLGELPDGAKVVIDARRTVDLDPDVKEIIDEFMNEAGKRGITCERVGFKDKDKKKPAELERDVKAVAQKLSNDN
jgi:MFS superfamily sulfate permease-like transporter